MTKLGGQMDFNGLIRSSPKSVFYPGYKEAATNPLHTLNLL